MAYLSIPSTRKCLKCVTYKFCSFVRFPCHDPHVRFPNSRTCRHVPLAALKKLSLKSHHLGGFSQPHTQTHFSARSTLRSPFGIGIDLIKNSSTRVHDFRPTFRPARGQTLLGSGRVIQLTIPRAARRRCSGRFTSPDQVCPRTGRFVCSGINCTSAMQSGGRVECKL